MHILDAPEGHAIAGARDVTTFLWILLGGILMSAIALVGSVTLVLRESTLEKLIVPLVSFAAGCLIGGALFHMIPAALTTMPVRLTNEFTKRNVALLGSSIDSVHSHIAWVRNIKQNFAVDIPFPIIADLDMRVAKAYPMVHAASSSTAAVPAVFFIDPQRRIRAMIYYPLNVGRNFDEILRVVDALQTADEYGVACPADWRPGQDVIVPTPSTTQGAEERMRDTNLQVTDWYFAKKSL